MPNDDLIRWLQPIVGDDDAPRQAPAGELSAAARDRQLLDAYSEAVIHVVETVSPSVISVSGPVGERPNGSGSGFLITGDGFAVTNSHVVGGRSKLVAETSDGDRVDAAVVGDDPASDLALLRLAARDLPAATVGRSDELRVGQLLIAMGSPLGLHSTVSTGIVSALGRSMRGSDGRLIENVIQHTAPINPGNSGGPLIDSRGHVVGVNTAIIAFAQGLGFAVPSATVQWVVGELLGHGQVRRRLLGITAAVRRLPRAMVRSLDLLADEVIEVAGVAPDGAGDRARLRPSDLIVAINDRVVSSIDELHRLLTRMPSDQAAELDIVRDGRKRTIVVRWDDRS